MTKIQMYKILCLVMLASTSISCGFSPPKIAIESNYDSEHTNTTKKFYILARMRYLDASFEKILVTRLREKLERKGFDVVVDERNELSLESKKVTSKARESDADAIFAIIEKGGVRDTFGDLVEGLFIVKVYDLKSKRYLYKSRVKLEPYTNKLSGDVLWGEMSADYLLDNLLADLTKNNILATN